MEKPRKYDDVQPAGEFTPLELGGHILVIKKVEETESKAGNEMIKIFLDTDRSDKQPAYYEEAFRNDIRPEKTWGCIVYQLTQDREGNANKGLKTFLTAVEKSNPGYEVVWGERFASSLQGKLVGGVFGREEYMNSMCEKKMSTKCFYFRSVETIKKGVDIPKDRLLEGKDNSPQPLSPAKNSDGFMNIEDNLPEELPF